MKKEMNPRSKVMPKLIQPEQQQEHPDDQTDYCTVWRRIFRFIQLLQTPVQQGF